jgi:uncharacterized protein (TIGR00299 family) protein
MILGALVDAGAPLTAIQTAIAGLGNPEVSVVGEPTSFGAVRGTRVRVEAAGDQPARDWAAIRTLLRESRLEPGVRDAALAVFAALARAEAQAHDVPEDAVHFHEVGAADAIVDIVGACVGLRELGVEQIASLPVVTGAGWARAEHGLLPVPAPATAILLAGARVPMRPDPPGAVNPGELLTPTGAAILATLAEWRVPPFTPQRVGYGFGTRELPWPNALRLWIGETAAGESDDAAEFLVATNIDDMNPQFFAPLMERLFAAGALDVWLSPATMKKGRPATIVSAIVPAKNRAAVERTLILESTTLGVRATPLVRTRAERRFETVATRWGEVRLKLRGWEGRVIGAMPEYDDCLRLSRDSGAPIREIWAEANRLGEVYIGRRWETGDVNPA